MPEYKDGLWRCICGCGQWTKSGGCEELWRAFTKAYSEPMDDMELQDLR